MKINDIAIQIDNGVVLDVGTSFPSSTINLRVNKILKIFKGDTELTGDRLSKAQDGYNKRGYIKLRAFERILFGTGVHVKLPDDAEMKIKPHKSITLNQGVTLLDNEIAASYDGEIQLVVYNGTSFLTTIEMNHKLAVGIVKKIDTLNFTLKENA